MADKLQTEHHLKFLSLKGGCTGLSESTLVKMPHCWNSHVAAHIACAQTELSGQSDTSTSRTNYISVILIKTQKQRSETVTCN